MAINWIKVIKVVTHVCSGVAFIGGAVTQGYDMKEAATKAVEEALKNKN